MIKRLIKPLCFALGLAALAAPADADVILFGDEPTAPMTYYSDAVQSDEQVAVGDYALKIEKPQWDDAGLISGKNSGVLVPEGHTKLEMKLYLPSDSGTFGNIKVYLSDQSNFFEYSNDSGGWTVDGEAISIADIPKDEWVTLSFDLTSIPNFDPGTSLLARIDTLPVRGGVLVYWDDVKLVVVPEPGSIGLFLTGGLLLLRRKRR